jgi:flavodoxin
VKSVIVYCSKTGNTEKIARAIRRGLNHDADLIKLDLTPDGLLRHYTPGFTFDLSGYDLVFFGGWVMVMRVHPFLAAYINRCGSLAGKRVSGFMTGGTVLSRGHVHDDFREMLSRRGAVVENFLYVTTLLGPLLTRKKILDAEVFGRSSCESAAGTLPNLQEH